MQRKIVFGVLTALIGLSAFFIYTFGKTGEELALLADRQAELVKRIDLLEESGAEGVLRLGEARNRSTELLRQLDERIEELNQRMDNELKGGMDAVEEVHKTLGDFDNRIAELERR
ncbi:hypothetical protein ACFL42_04205 [Candidatus Omnitrophota bacterium]